MPHDKTQLSGEIVQVFPEERGTSARGDWRKQGCVLRTKGDYPKTVFVQAWGDKIDEFRLSEGDDVTLSVNLESREYNGRWYTGVRVWRVERARAAQDRQGTAYPEAGPDVQNDTDDIPF